MPNEENKEVINEAIHAHVTLMQSIIQRMANNSAGVKTWCIALVSAILFAVSTQNEPRLAYLALLPAVVFLFLDTFYLALERGFRESYNTLIKDLHESKIKTNDLYIVAQPKNMGELYLKSLTSFSIYPFYLMIIGMIIIVALLIL